MRKNLYLLLTALFLLASALMLWAAASAPSAVRLLKEFRPIGGAGNNLENPTLDAVPGSPERALAPQRYADGTVDGLIDGPNPRLISNVLAGGSGEGGADSQTPDPTASAWLYVFGQFVDHDLDLEFSPPGGRPIDIPVPPGDPVFKDGTTIKLTRDTRSPVTNTAINTVAGYLDLSQLYGSAPALAADLRNEDGTLKTSNQGSALQIVNGRFITGDLRVNENPELAAVTILFLREHNYWVAELKGQNPGWSGEQLYQMARAITTAEYQNIVYQEFLPLLIGPVLGPYQRYNPGLSAQVSQEFSTAAFRAGHSQISETQSGIDNDGKLVFTQSLAQAFFNTAEETLANGVAPLMRNVTAEFAQATDVYTVPVLRNLLFAPLPGGNIDQVDLIAIDIQRARDLGLGTLNQTRKALGLAPYTTFAELTADGMLQARFQQVYGAIGAVDLFMGGLAEGHAADAAVGPTFQAIIRKQFEALRDGDRFFWRNQGFDRATAERIAATRLSHIIRRNTDTTSITENAFLASGKPERKPPRAPAGPVDNHGRLGPPFILR